MINYSSFLSKISRRRQPSAIRALQPLMSVQGMISLGGGAPNPHTFPISSMEITLKDGTRCMLGERETVEALQYSPTCGLPVLVNELVALQEREHSPVNPFKVMVSTGSQDALTKAFDMLLDPGESLLVENPTYSGALAFLEPAGVNLCAVQTDGGGMVPGELERILREWDSGSRDDVPKPRLLYVIPNGANPSGASLETARRKEIYDICRQHELLILEDDPYYYLQLDGHRQHDGPPSLFSLDEDGRVLRFDSFSKLISSGLRLGFASGPPELVDRMELHQQATSLHPSGLSQAVCAALLSKWGSEGFDKHVENVVNLYKVQRNAALQSCEKHLRGLATWTSPSAGMFLWISIQGCEDTASLVRDELGPAKVLMVPGESFTTIETAGDRAGADVRPNSSFVRASYSIASPEEMDIAFERLGALLRSRTEKV